MMLHADDGPTGLFIRVASGCDHGASVSWSPADAAKLIAEAKAKDGLPVVIVLRSSGQPPVHLLAKVNNRQVAAATIR